jgi:hypothetical protein
MLNRYRPELDADVFGALYGAQQRGKQVGKVSCHAENSLAYYIYYVKPFSEPIQSSYEMGITSYLLTCASKQIRGFEDLLSLAQTAAAHLLI